MDELIAMPLRLASTAAPVSPGSKEEDLRAACLRAVHEFVLFCHKRKALPARLEEIETCVLNNIEDAGEHACNPAAAQAVAWPALAAACSSAHSQRCICKVDEVRATCERHVLYADLWALASNVVHLSARMVQCLSLSSGTLRWRGCIAAAERRSPCFQQQLLHRRRAQRRQTSRYRDQDAQPVPPLPAGGPI